MKRRNNILVSCPAITCRAAYVLLVEKYMNAGAICKSRPTPKMHYKKWLAYRDKFVLQVKKLNGELHCEYCGKEGLKITQNNKHPLCVTVDHIIPLAKNGDIKDITNFAIACTKCNNKKADKKMEIKYPYKINWRK